MNNLFAHRSSEKELLDQEDIPQKDLFQNLKELDAINRMLGGYQAIFKGINKLIPKPRKQAVRVLDIGSGGGDTLRQIYRKYNGRLELHLTGVDLKPDCIQYAQNRNKNLPLHFIESNYKDIFRLEENTQYDIITASLFCHHLSDDELIKLFSWMNNNARTGFIINDIHRNPWAYYSIKYITKLFSKSYLVKNDAALSVLRAFKKAELENLLQQAGIENYRIEWIWAFRWLVTVKTAENV